VVCGIGGKGLIDVLLGSASLQNLTDCGKDPVAASRQLVDLVAGYRAKIQGHGSPGLCLKRSLTRLNR
jgi:hypothetical protein